MHAPDEAGGRRAKCPRCQTVLTVPAGPPKKDVAGPDLTRGILLWLIAGILFVCAAWLNSDLDQQDRRSDRIDESVYRFNAALGQFPTKAVETPRASRAWVYVLTSLGALFVAAGAVCFVLDAPRQGAKRGSLRPCPDCGREVSRRASQCPHCGCPLGQ
jgi:hypothetical protein